jgi:glycosyltransferase involved in cell wall biosynthesis
MVYSVIVPVYNRPDEIDELLASLARQTYRGDLEVIIVEDGSAVRCEEIVKKYIPELDIRYFYKENSGQGFSRNFGFERAKGDFLVVFDSDCIIPDHYFDTVTSVLTANKIDCWGGPDRAHASFTPLQKAINYSMTSLFTTGGIRGKKMRIGDFHPRSFNMGISREVFEKTGGYRITRMGEDIEFSLRIAEQGFTTALIPDAYVYHKRRTSLRQFWKQLFFFGRARINIQRFYPDELKVIHLMPALFLLGMPASLLLLILGIPLLQYSILAYPAYAALLFFDSMRLEKNAEISALAVAAGFIQLSAYGAGFMKELSAGNPDKRE